MAGSLAQALQPSMGMTTPNPSQRRTQASLRLEHEEIDAALERVLQAFATDDRDVARTAFREFDARFTEHLAMEEDLLLPEFSEVDPAEAAQIAAEHRAIRSKIDELAIGTDLHVTRIPAVKQLAETIRAHARREDALLYKWADRRAADDRQQAFDPSSIRQAPSYPTR